MRNQQGEQLGLPLDCCTSPAHLRHTAQTATPAVKPGSDGDPYHRLRQRLPEQCYLGSCGWAYPEWVPVVWSGWHSRRELLGHGLSEYARHPLLRTLLLEMGDGRDMSASWFRRIALQLPAGMRCGVQVPWQVTVPRTTREHFGESLAADQLGKCNPHFLDPAYFRREVFEPCCRGLGDHLGLIVLTFPPLLRTAGLQSATFAHRLEQFFESVAALDIPFAVELREPQLLSLAYAKVLARFSVAHVFTSWDGMPSLVEQARWVPSSTELVVRMDAPSLAARTRRFREPALYDRLQVTESRWRREIVELLASHRSGPAFVFVSNTAEGSAPLSIIALAQAIADDPIEARRPQAE